MKLGRRLTSTILTLLLLGSGCGGGSGSPTAAGSDTAGADARQPRDSTGDAAPPDTGTDTRSPAPDSDANAPDSDAEDTGMDTGRTCPVPPSNGVWATFEVAGETFRALLTSSDTISKAKAIWRGESDQKIPGGDLVCERKRWNCNYSWHLEPGSINFADSYVEVCDGAPSYIENNCESFVDNYCPWGAVLVGLQDCRDGTCDPVSK